MTFCGNPLPPSLSLKADIVSRVPLLGTLSIDLHQCRTILWVQIFKYA
jgi:hypothetical protein